MVYDTIIPKNFNVTYLHISFTIILLALEPHDVTRSSDVTLNDIWLNQSVSDYSD